LFPVKYEKPDGEPGIPLFHHGKKEGRKEMTEKNLNSCFINLTKTIFVTAALFSVFAASAKAEKLKLTLEDAPLIILKDSTVTKKINGIPRVAGSLSLKIKWHVLSFIPNTFNKLKVELLHGTRVLVTKECYSQHSDRTPKCSITRAIDDAEADAAGDYKLRVTNDNNDDVGGFNILKELTDVNPSVAGIESTFERDCNIIYPYLMGADSIDGGLTINNNSTIETVLVILRYGEGGRLHIKAKWHGLSLNPNFTSFHPLKVEVLYNDTVVKSDEGYSIHANEKGMTDKIDIIINARADQRSASWKLRITNSESKATGFNIEKGNDWNLFVPSFRSTYNPCN
jgi:hypothetical protein